MDGKTEKRGGGVEQISKGYVKVSRHTSLCSAIAYCCSSNLRITASGSGNFHSVWLEMYKPEACVPVSIAHNGVFTNV